MVKGHLHLGSRSSSWAKEIEKENWYRLKNKCKKVQDLQKAIWISKLSRAKYLVLIWVKEYAREIYKQKMKKVTTQPKIWILEGPGLVILGWK